MTWYVIEAQVKPLRSPRRQQHLQKSALAKILVHLDAHASPGIRLVMPRRLRFPFFLDPRAVARTALHEPCPILQVTGA